MTWEEALVIVLERTKHEPYRKLCADEHPAHEAWRRRMIEKATGEAPASYPGLFAMAGNLAGALGRAIDAAVHGEPVLVPAEVIEARQAICAACPEWVAEARRCRICGCYTDAKLRLACEQCPLPEPRWPRWEKPTDDA
jgi:hypothetical protein